MKNIAFRVDASGMIGTGHFMRCLTLAEALQRHGARVRFISRALPPHLAAMLAERGMACAHLPPTDGERVSTGVGPCQGDEPTHLAWLGTSQERDAQRTAQVLADGTWDWLIVDHYALDHRWETVLRGAVRRIMAIDDLADRPHDCDLLLDQNFYSDMGTRYADKVPTSARLLLGPRHALLREDFSQFRARCAPRTGRVGRILVFFGGVDAGDYTGAAIQALGELGLPPLQVDVVIGLQHPHRAAVEAACAAAGFVCHVQTTRMAELTAAADLALSAGGSAAWERCCLGLPALSLCTADNQSQQIIDAAEAGLLYAPAVSEQGYADQRGHLVELIRRHVRTLMENPALLRHISRCAMDAVDGQGAMRVASVLMDHPAGSPPQGIPQPRVALRLADESDARVVLPWRNAESTRRHFFDPSPVEPDAHLVWWARSLQDPGRALLIAHQAETACGVLRFDFDQPGTAVASLYLDPAMTGQGLGRAVMWTGLDWLRQNCPSVHQVSAEILPANLASRRMFASVGFAEQHAVFVRKV